MRKLVRVLGLLIAVILSAKAPPAAADTTGPITLTYSNLVAGADALPFVLPKFDPSLGSLQTVHIAFHFSGTLSGNATDVTQSAPIETTITHWVFFEFTDLSDNLFVVEPTLNLSAGIPSGAQNVTIPFGPEFQSTSNSFSITSEDLRFNAWANGPGTFAGILKVYFTNTSLSPIWGLRFFSGTDTGVYQGWLSITYDYVPVRDDDDDGVPDNQDECPNTPPGAIVDQHGCTIAQLVPCAGPLGGGSWKNHGEFVNSVKSVAERFLTKELITRKEAAAIFEAAAKSDCGKKSKL